MVTYLYIIIGKQNYYVALSWYFCYISECHCRPKFGDVIWTDHYEFINTIPNKNNCQSILE
jgi:hypothetical protein